MVKLVKTNIKLKKTKNCKKMKKHNTDIDKKKKAVDFFMRDFAKEINDET